VYGFGSAFTSFCNSAGLASLVARIKEEVDDSLKLVKQAEATQMSGVTTAGGDIQKGTLRYQMKKDDVLNERLYSYLLFLLLIHQLSEEESPIPFEKTALLKAMFKFVIHMMQSPGTQEGLRNLIDTSLPSTLKDVMENPSSLGTSVYAHGMDFSCLYTRYWVLFPVPHSDFSSFTWSFSNQHDDFFYP